MLKTRAQLLVSSCWGQSIRSVPCGTSNRTYHFPSGREVSLSSGNWAGQAMQHIPGKQWSRHKSFDSGKQQEPSSAVTELKDGEYAQLTLGQKAKETAKDAGYLGVIVAGLGVTGLMLYAILNELFSSQSPYSVYSKALEVCRSSDSVKQAIGEPIKGYGEETTRGRRRHVSHLEFFKDGIKHMRVKFYIEGNRKKGTVHLEVKQNDQGKYEYSYLFVNVEGYPRQTIIIEDNRMPAEISVTS